MKTKNCVTMMALLTCGVAVIGYAQTPAPGAGNNAASPGSDPSAASTPHQRDAMSHDAMSKDGSGMKMAAEKDGAIPATFVKKAALGGMTEVEAGKVALSKSQDPAVKQFADRMVKDHGKANTELASIAKSKGLDVPMVLDTEHKAMVKELSSKSGAQFDAAYSKHMVMDHAKTIALFEGATKSSDSDLAAFAKKTLPTLKEHKQMADSLPGASQ